MSDASEREDLEQLMLHPGWLRYRAYVESQWGADACIQKIDTALSTLERGDQQAANETVTQIRARAREAQRLLMWPRERVNTLMAMESQRKQEPTYSRRGTL